MLSLVVTASANLCVGIILTFSFLTAFIPWISFVINKNKKRTIFKIGIEENENLPGNRRQITIQLKHIIKPIFGYIRLRLFYDRQNISPKFSVVSLRSKKFFFSNQIEGIFNWPIQHIKEYEIKEGIIYFEDFFQFFSFATRHAANGNFFTAPPHIASQEMMVKPKMTEETTSRIEEIRKVEGEFLNYKNFENNDDVRRIVWKIYA